MRDRLHDSSPPASLAAAELLPELYRTEPDDGWSAGMHAITHALLDGIADGAGLPAGPILEVGCGGGQFLAELCARYPQRAVYGVDLHPLALAHAQARPAAPVTDHQSAVTGQQSAVTSQQSALVQAPLQRLPFPASTFALVLALDSFDQQGVDLAAALAESHRLLCPGGRLLLRVSAHPRLYGAHDRAFHTGRRYTRLELIQALTAAGFALHRVTYANLLLGAPVAIQRLLQRWGLLAWQPGLYTHPAAHEAVALALRLEAHWLHRLNLPIGLSLWAVAERE
jgi:SAM-dependent methyltransferase